MIGIIVVSWVISSPIAAFIDGLIKGYFSGSIGVYINTLVSLIVTTAIISICIQFIVVRPLNELLDITKKISKGDLTSKVAFKSGDEIGQLAIGFNEMISNLQELIEKVSDTGKKVSSVGLNLLPILNKRLMEQAKSVK